MAMYESDITRFIRELKRQRPQIELEQREGRAIFWDRQRDLDTMKREQESRVPQQAYVYQNKV